MSLEITRVFCFVRILSNNWWFTQVSDNKIQILLLMNSWQLWAKNVLTVPNAFFSAPAGLSSIYWIYTLQKLPNKKKYSQRKHVLCPTVIKFKQGTGQHLSAFYKHKDTKLWYIFLFITQTVTLEIPVDLFAT